MQPADLRGNPDKIRTWNDIIEQIIAGSVCHNEYKVACRP